MKSLWTDGITLPEFKGISGDTRCDVLIIGGGITGILTAYFLEQNRVNYVLVEKGRICNGTTQNTTAKITSQHGLIYNKLLQNNGLEYAQLYLKANENALNEYRKICGSIKCDFEAKDNYVYSVYDRKRLEDEVLAMQKIGYNAEFVNTKNLPFKTLGAVKFKNQAQFHPLRFISEIIKGLNIFENTKVLDLDGNIAITDKGKITSKTIIITTHFPFINSHGSYFLKLYQHRSYVSAFENAKQLDGMYVDESQKGFSFRNYKNLLLLGGAGHRTGMKNNGWTELRSVAKEHYPNSVEKYYWAAQDCISLDSVAYIGKYSENTPNWYTATGFNKWGMTGSMLSAQILCDLVMNKSNEYAQLFNPSRSILKPQLLLNGFETLTNFVTPITKRCSHMGCALKWNKYEHSWDCSCHGSRFTADGKLIENPANKDLK